MSKELCGEWTFSQFESGLSLIHKSNWFEKIKLVLALSILLPFIFFIIFFLFAWIHSGINTTSRAGNIFSFFFVIAALYAIVFALSSAFRHLCSRKLIVNENYVSVFIGWFRVIRLNISEIRKHELYLKRGSGGMKTNAQLFIYLRLKYGNKQNYDLFLFACDELTAEERESWHAVFRRINGFPTP